MDILRLALSSNPAAANACPGVQDLLQALSTQQEALRLDVYICSYGGVGSTELNNFLNRFGEQLLLTSTERHSVISRGKGRGEPG